jgi:predicted TIM-barrel fold metal-dependent hydrolase
MIIDGHAHASGDFLTPEGITQVLNSTNADKVVLVPGEIDRYKAITFPNFARIFPKSNITKFWNILTKLVVMKITKINKKFGKYNEYIYELTKKLPNKVIQFYLITDINQYIKQELDEKFANWKFKGLKIHQCWYKISVDSKIFYDTANWAEKHDLPIFIHLESEKEVKKLIEYKRSHPKLKMIIGHLFGLELFIKSKIKFENLFFDISTYQVTSNYRVLKTIEYFGADKIILGSDTPYGKENLKKNIERLEKLPLSNDDKNMILGLNMKKLLNV